jgi:predicted Zn finger-like uncharacterized protein
MALATQCPHCGKRFRVASDQLKLRGGIVRCGACHEIFDGNASLIDLDAFAAKHAASAAPAAPANADTHSAAEPASATDNASRSEHDGEPIYTLNFDDTFDPFGILPKIADEKEPSPPAAQAQVSEPVTEQPAPEPQAEPESGRVEPNLGLPVNEELVAAALPDHDHAEPTDQPEAQPEPAAPAAATKAPLPMRASAPTDPLAAPAQPQARPMRPAVAPAKAGRRSKLTPTKIAQPKLRAPEIDEPEFVKLSRQREQSGKTRRVLLAVGSVVLLLALAIQGILIFRNVLAARFPAAKPAVAALCAALGCRVELPTQIENLAIEQGELVTLGGNTYSLTTLLHNQGGLTQTWPHIELTLTDANDKPLLRRVFTPREYLPQGVASGFAPRAEQQVKLYFQLGQLKPSGYRIAIFYP